jgi:hypothetical protein
MLMAALFAPTVLAQGWSQAYEAALEAARGGNWPEARASFKQAAAYRTEDFSGPTNLPGPATERRQWRGGAPYSPNFLAAYSAYRIGESASGTARSENLRAAANEFEALHAKGQFSPESFYFLNLIYTSLGSTEARMKLDERFAELRGKVNFKVDTEVVAPEERTAVEDMMGRLGPVVQPPDVPGGTPPTGPPATGGTIPLPGTGATPSLGMRVPQIGSKFALLIGNSESRIAGQSVAFSSDDAHRVREALTMSAGYPEENIDLIQNATAAQMLASAKALAERVPKGGVVFLYFSGVGVNLDGKDYFAGVDTESATDSATMAAKAEIYRLFMAKGATVFAFFQVNRPVSNGRYFGQEVPLFGSASQAQATMPGESVHSYVRDGRPVGIFTDALVSTLNEIRSNQVPILEFGWQLFYRMRRGGTGSDGGGSRQTPTLPVLTYMASDAKF